MVAGEITVVVKQARRLDATLALLLLGGANAGLRSDGLETALQMTFDILHRLPSWTYFISWPRLYQQYGQAWP
jgi:hypothetical protein